MTLIEILQAISTYGFPIVACVILGFYVNNVEKRHKEERLETENKYTKSIDQLRTCLDNNTQALNTLVNMLSNKK